MKPWGLHPRPAIRTLDGAALPSISPRIALLDPADYGALSGLEAAERDEGGDLCKSRDEQAPPIESSRASTAEAGARGHRFTGSLALLGDETRPVEVRLGQDGAEKRG